MGISCVPTTLFYNVPFSWSRKNGRSPKAITLETKCLSEYFYPNILIIQSIFPSHHYQLIHALGLSAKSTNEYKISTKICLLQRKKEKNNNR